MSQARSSRRQEFQNFRNEVDTLYKQYGEITSFKASQDIEKLWPGDQLLTAEEHDEMVEASSGVNLWKEWAKLETAVAKGEKYTAPKATKKYSGIVISLSRFQHPDSSSFNAPEIWWRMEEEYHIGMILQSDNQARILELLDEYANRIFSDFHASAPVPNKPTH